ncbi:hypothetical protein [Gordonia sp. SND2]|uniref:hypothetical protein n=1 Tax=Gordonia sp. SND2 TaxID=3388659 RepID=UPI00398ACF9F
MTDHGLSPAEQRHLATALHNLHDWIAEALTDAVTRQDSHAGAPKVSGTRDTALPFNEHASDAAWDLRNTLNAWITAVHTQRHFPHPGADIPIETAARWLETHIIALALIDDAHTAYDEIHHAIERARRAIDRPTRPDYLGTCPTPNCDADLWALPADNPVICRTCTTTHHRQTIEAAIDRELRTRHFTARELVPIVQDRLGITIRPKTIYELARRRTDPITHTGHNHRGDRIYRCGDILDALTEPTPHARLQHAITATGA